MAYRDDLAKHKASWAIELLQARESTMWTRLLSTTRARFPSWAYANTGSSELVREAASAEPLLFARTIVPYLRQVMAATAAEPREDHPIRDLHFSTRLKSMTWMATNSMTHCWQPRCKHWNPLRGVLLLDDVRPLLEGLASDSYDGSQFLLYRALEAGGAYFANCAASRPLEGGRRLDCGYISDSHWVARELVRAISPHVSNKTHRQLEDQFRDLRNPYETRHSAGRSAFTFLSALADRPPQS